MIDVNDLFLLTQDLIRKDHQGGYTSNDEYNRALTWVQEVLYEYCYDNRNESFARQSLIEFENEVILTESIGGYTKPTDFKDKLDAFMLVPNSAPIPVHFPARDEWAMSLSSPIRGGSLERNVVIGKIGKNLIEVDPSSTGYQLKLRYYTILPAAIRAVTIDPVTIQEVYDLGSSVQLQWDDHNLTNLTDLLLLYKGIVIRDSSLVQWVQAHNTINTQIYENK